jgi:UDP-N-acetylglucosamine transferase subunit ALG13
VILVTTGTNGEAFDRLISWVEDAVDGEELVIQGGPSSLRPAGARFLDYLHFEELTELIRDARAVVCHGGVGSILVTILNNKRPLVVPRLARQGEAIDDHQLDLARRLAEENMVVLVESPVQLRESIRRGSRWPSENGNNGTRTNLVRELAAYLDVATGRSGAESRC